MVRYYSTNSERVTFKICRTKAEFEREYPKWLKLARNLPFYVDTITHHGLIIYRIRDYKNIRKATQIGCAECGAVHEKDVIKKAKLRNDGTPYQNEYTCPNCNCHIGYDWIG